MIKKMTCATIAANDTLPWMVNILLEVDEGMETAPAVERLTLLAGWCLRESSEEKARKYAFLLCWRTGMCDIDYIDMCAYPDKEDRD